MTELTDRHCVPIHRGAHPLSPADAMDLMAQIPAWRPGPGTPPRLVRELRFDTYKLAMDFANAVAGIAEIEQHHPDVEVGWVREDMPAGSPRNSATYFLRVRVSLHTHAAGGLTMNDFVMAAKIDQLVGSPTA